MCEKSTRSVEACSVTDSNDKLILWQLCDPCATIYHKKRADLNPDSSSDDDMPPLEPFTPPEDTADAADRETRLLEHYKVMEARGHPGLLETYTHCSHGPVYMLHDGSLLAACGRC